MGKVEWLLCPICKNKTRTKLREDTVLENFLLFCPKCKQETLINVRQLNIFVIIHRNTLNKVENKHEIWYNLFKENHMWHEESLYIG